jgi:hypothetical protein
VEGAFQERDVPQQACQTLGGRVALGSSAPDGQQDEGKIGPGRLVVEPGNERLEITVADSLVRHQGGSGAVGYGTRQGRQILADLSLDPGFRQDGARHDGIAPHRREDQDPLGPGRVSFTQLRSSMSIFSSSVPIKVGTPRSTPWNC